MKRVLLLVMALILSLSVTSCKKNEIKENTETTPPASDNITAVVKSDRSHVVL